MLNFIASQEFQNNEEMDLNYVASPNTGQNEDSNEY